MRLTSLRLIRYGNFENEFIPFNPAPGVVNLLLAPNGGGKSVLRAAFCDLLFNIPGQSPMGFRHGYAGMRILAEGRDKDGSPFSFGRRKGHGNTLIDANGNALDPVAVTRLLGRTDRARLERLFALDTERLRQGEADLLASDGDLGQALASGAGEARNLPDVRKRLEEMRDNLAPRRRSANKPFYGALDRYQDARKRQDASMLRPRQWAELQAGYDQAVARQAEANGAVAAASADIARLERIRRVRPLLATLDNAAAWLEAHPGAPVLDPVLGQRLSQAREQLVLAEDRLRRARERADHDRDALAGIVVDDAMLAVADDIDRLVDVGGAAGKARDDLPAVRVQAREAAATIVDLLRDLGRDLPLERAAEAVPSRAAINHVRRLIQTHGTLRKEEQNGPAVIAKWTMDRDAAVAALAALPVAADMSALETALKEARAEGDPLRQARLAAKAHATARASLDAALARVPGLTSGIAGLMAIAPLPLDAYERDHAALEQVRRDITPCQSALREAVSKRDSARDALAALVQSGPLPDEAALLAARQHRDHGWHIIYRRAFTPDPPTSAEEHAFAGTTPLPLAYEEAMAAADGLADRRVQEAELVAQAHAMQTALGKAEAAVEAASLRHDQAVLAVVAAEEAWGALCAPFPLGRTPVLADVRSFLKARDEAIAAAKTEAEMSAAKDSLAAMQAAWARGLGALLGLPDSTPLLDLLQAADARLAHVRAAEKTRAAHEATRQKAEAELANAEAAHRQAVGNLEQWQADWARAVQDLGRSMADEPAVVSDLLDTIKDLDEQRKSYHSLNGRVMGMEADMARFRADLGALASRVAVDVAADDPFLLIGTLRQRLQAAQGAAAARDSAKKQAEDAARLLEIADQQAAEATATVKARLAVIGGETVEAAEARLALAAARAGHAATVADVTRKLMEEGDGQPLDQLRQDIAMVSSEDLLARLDAARQCRENAHAAAQAESATAARLQAERRQAEAGTGAVDAAADQQAALATISRTLEEALVCHIAAELLDQALTTAAQDAEPAMMQRISARFTSLTNGTYSRVMATDTNDGQTRLALVQRDYPTEQQAVKELSEGTRDQLYLALRLAAIEDFADAPLPFIGDDILQTFDDDRAIAALRVLRDVSERVQVILLTHHRHVLDLARALPSGAVHVHRLGALAEVA